jgi:Putative inner membrane protein (DUF1819)
MLKSIKYDFSYTSASLRLQEMILVAKAFVGKRTIDFTNELGNGKFTTGKRMLAEFQKRINRLTPEELDVLIHGDLTSQKQIAFLSICKSSYFIRDFMLEVIREKYLIFDYQITDGDYISYYRRKYESHPEMEKLTEITAKKVKQVIFKILEQSGIIDNIKSKNIQPQLLDETLIDAILKDNPTWLKVLLMSDKDIGNLTK